MPPHQAMGTRLVSTRYVTEQSSPQVRFPCIGALYHQRKGKKKGGEGESSLS